MYSLMYRFPEKGQNQAVEIPPDLVEVANIWPNLTDHIKKTIKTLIDPFMEEKTNEQD